MNTINSSSTRTVLHFNTLTNTKNQPLPLPQVLIQSAAVGTSSTSSSAVFASTGATTTSTESDATANPTGNANDSAKNGHLFRCPSANSAASSSVTTTVSCLTSTSTADGGSDQRRKCCWRRRRKWRKNRQRTDDALRIPFPGDERIMLPPRPRILPQGMVASTSTATATNTDVGILRRYSSLLRSSLRRRCLAPPTAAAVAATAAIPTNGESGEKPSASDAAVQTRYYRQLVDSGFLSTALPTIYCDATANPSTARTYYLGIAKSNCSAPTLLSRRQSSSSRQKCDRQLVVSPTASGGLPRRPRRSSRSSGSGHRRRRSSTRQCILEVSASPPHSPPASAANGLCGMMVGVGSRVLPPPLIGVVRVHMRRRTVNAQLGLGIAGGCDRHIPPTISYLRPGLVAYRSDQLQPGDRLARVNGIEVGVLTHHEIMTLLRNAGTDVVLDVEYDLNAPVFQGRDGKNDAVAEKCAEIVLENDADEEENAWEADAIDEEDGGFRSGGLATANGSLYGMTLRGGAYGPDVEKSKPLTVTAIRPGGPAHREGRLRVGDRVIAIDGVDVSGATLGAAQRLLRRARRSVQLTVVYDVSILASLRQAVGRPLVLEIEKTPGANFGIIFTIRRRRLLQVEAEEPPGHQPPHHSLSVAERPCATTQSIVVEKLIAASIADRCGALHVGDEIHSIDGISLELTGLAEAYQLLKSQASVVRVELTPFPHRQNQWLTRASASPAAPRRALYCDYVPHATLQQQAIETAGVAAKNQRRQFHPDGRPIPASFTAFPRRRFIDPVSGTPIEQLYEDNRVDYSARSDSAAVKNGPPTVVDPSLRYMSASMTLGGGRSPSAADSPLMARSQRSSSAATGAGAGTRRRRSSIFPLLFRNNTTTSGGGGATPEKQQETGSVTTKFLPAATAVSSSASTFAPTASLHHYPSGVNDGASTSRGGIPCGQLCHAETMEIRLHCASANANGDDGQLSAIGGAPFGIELSYRNSGGERNCGADFGGGGDPLIISKIERGSPADKCGVLQVGDRVMAVNDWLTADGTVEEAAYVLRRAANASACVQLLVQFDVIEPVLPASGYFVVKLAKRANNLGVVCKSSSVVPCGGGPKGEPLIVADIRTGSVAHRSGSIKIGDRIFAIDNIPLDTCTVEEAMRLLQRSGGVVKLCIARRQNRHQFRRGTGNLNASFDDVNNGGVDTTTPYYANLNTHAAYTQQQSLSKNTGCAWPLSAAQNEQLHRRGQFAATSLQQQQQQSAVVYAVELGRRGQPLGITIASASSALGDADAVVISQLAAGGLAERTGALHVGDEILAVNGRLLDDEAVITTDHPPTVAANDDRPALVSDRRLAAAIRLLQQSEDVVAIRLRRRPSLSNDNLGGVPSWWRSSTLSGASVGTVGGASYSATRAPPPQLKNHHQSPTVVDQHLSNSTSNNHNNTVTNTTAPLSTINSDSMSDDGEDEVDGDGDGENSVDSGRGNRHHNNRDTMLIGSDTGDLLVGSGSARTAVDNLETPLKSIDSAVESLEGSSADGNVPPATKATVQRRKKNRQQQKIQGDHRTDYSNNNNNSDVAASRSTTSRFNSTRAPDLISGGGSSSGGAWDSGLSSTADNNAAAFLAGGGLAGMTPIGGVECCGCGSAGGSGGATTTSPSSVGKGTATNTTTSGAASTHEEEDWMRILDALETVGEEEMLRKLEECIMSGRMSSNHADSVGGCHQCRRKHQYSPPRRNFHFPPLGVDQSSNGILARRLVGGGVVNSANSIDESSSNYYASVISATPPPPQPSLSVRQPPFTSREGDYVDSALMEERCRSPPPTNVTSSMYSVLKKQKSKPVPPPPPFRSVSAKGVGITLGVNSELVSSSCPSGTSTLELPPPMPFLPAHHAAPISESTATIALITSPLSAPTVLDNGRRSTAANDTESGGAWAENGEPPIHEIFNVVLERCTRQRSFGFSVSDGDPTNPGVFVNTVIRGGPADGLLKPLDRILQINGTSIQFLNCDLAVPLLATDKVELLLLRKPHHHQQQQPQTAEQQMLFNNNNSNLIEKHHSAFI